MTFEQEQPGRLQHIGEETEDLAYELALRNNVADKMRDMTQMGLDPTNPADIQRYYAITADADRQTE
jgi:hypothetical protein